MRNAVACIFVALLFGPVMTSRELPATHALRPMFSERFAGYTVDYSHTGKNISDILGYWTVPYVQPSQETSLSTEFVGLDLDSGTGLQIGTSQFSQGGTVLYRAFYAIYPDNASRPVVIRSLNGEVGPGMVIGSEMTLESGGNWTLTILVMNRSFNPIDFFTIEFAHATPALMGEWSVGRPAGLGLLLANFTSVEFLGANATVSGQQLILPDMPSTSVTLIDAQTGCMLAAPGPVTRPTPSFSTSFLLAGPPCMTQAAPANDNSTAPEPPLDLRLPFIVGSSLVAGVLLSIGVLTVSSVGSRWKRAKANAGTSLAQTAATCSKCGKSFHSGAGYCDQCGTKVDTTVSEPDSTARV